MFICIVDKFICNIDGFGDFVKLFLNLIMVEVDVGEFILFIVCFVVCYFVCNYVWYWYYRMNICIRIMFIVVLKFGNVLFIDVGIYMCEVIVYVIGKYLGVNVIFELCVKC